jgi:hypothetical protein
MVRDNIYLLAFLPARLAHYALSSFPVVESKDPHLVSFDFRAGMKLLQHAAAVGAFNHFLGLVLLYGRFLKRLLQTGQRSKILDSHLSHTEQRLKLS